MAALPRNRVDHHPCRSGNWCRHNQLHRRDARQRADQNPRLPSTWCQFGIEMQLTIPLDGSDPTYAITGEVAYASIQLAVLAVPFISLTFIVQSGQKLTVKPQVNEIVFTNELKFVNSLRDFLNAFSDPPFLDVTDTDVTAGFTLSLPNIDVGVFSCQNIAVGAKIIIPYFGDSLAIGFNFCTQDNPFLLICFFFGGGGFFEVDVSPVRSGRVADWS